MQRKAEQRSRLLSGRRRPTPSWHAGVAVGRDQATGTNDVVDGHPTLEVTAQRLRADQNFSRRAPRHPAIGPLPETGRRNVTRFHQQCDCPAALREMPVARELAA